MHYGTLQPRKCGAEVQLEFKFKPSLLPQTEELGDWEGGGERETRGINELPK